MSKRSAVKGVEERKKRQHQVKEMLEKHPNAMQITTFFSQGFTSDPSLAKILFKLLLESLDTRVSDQKHLELNTVYFDCDEAEIMLDVANFTEGTSSVVQNLFADLLKIAFSCNVNSHAKWSQFSERVSGLTDIKKILEDRFMGSIDPKNAELHSDPNAFISKKIYKVAELRKLHGDSTSETAHKNAAYAIKTHKIPIKSFADVVGIKGVGPKIAAKIDEILDTGTLSILEDKTEMEKVVELFQTIWGVGPEHAKQWFELGCRTIEDIAKFVELGKIKFNRNQKICFEHRLDLLVEMPRTEMEELHSFVVKAISMGEKNSPLPFEAEIIGSYRRGKLASKDVDVLIYPKKDQPCNRVMMQRVCRIIGDNLVKLAKGYHELALGNKKLECAINVGKGWRRLDVFVTSLESLACSRVAFTGPGDFNRKQRETAQKKGWLLNEMNLYDEKGDVIPTNSEKDVFERLGMTYLEPKDRK